MIKKKLLAGLLGFIAILALVLLSTCDMGVVQAKIPTVDAVTPVITVQPAVTGTVPANSQSPYDMDVIESISIGITVGNPTDGGSLIYQWYWYPGTGKISDSEEIKGAADATLTLTSQGLEDYPLGFFVWVKVTNKNDEATGKTEISVNSDPVPIVLQDGDPADKPEIKEQQQPAGASYVVGDTIQQLTVSASVTDSGTLSYQWYSNTSNSNAGGTPIEDATTSSYQPTVTAVGLYYYYVEVTNTDSTATGSKTASVSSSAVEIKLEVRPSQAPAPTILIQPQNPQGTIYITETPAISVTATVPTGTMKYQWYSATTSTAAGTAISGATNPSHSPTSASAATVYYYVTIINTLTGTDDSDPVTSARASVTYNTFNATFTVNSDTKYQYVRGFGGMDSPWENTVPLTLENYEKFFHPGDPDDPGNFSGDNGMGYNIMRIMLYPWNTDPNITMTDLTTKSTGNYKEIYRPYQYEGVKIVNKYGGYVLGSPWSPPAVWKTNNSILGSDTARLKNANYKDFAAYLNEFAWNFYNNGAPLYAISMQNEPSYTSGSDYEGCRYTVQQHLAWWQEVGHFIKNAAANKAGATPAPGYGGGIARPNVLTMSGEAHNEIAWLNNVTMNATVSANIDIMGRHIYGSNTDPTGTPTATGTTGPAALAWGNTGGNNYRAAREAAGRETWMTEHNVNGGNATNYPNDSTWAYIWKFMNEVDLVIRLNKENAFIWWTAKRFYSLMGDDKGLMNNGLQINGYSTTLNAILPRGYGLSHYAKFAKEMRQVALTYSGTNSGGTNLTATQINNTTYSQDSTAAKVTAFMSEDGNTISVIMMTPTNTSGNNGQNLGTIKIQLPAGFTVAKAVGMKSIGTSNTARTVTNTTERPTIGVNKNCAYVTMPANQILSVRFTKE